MNAIPCWKVTESFKLWPKVQIKDIGQKLQIESLWQSFSKIQFLIFYKVNNVRQKPLLFGYIIIHIYMHIYFLFYNICFFPYIIFNIWHLKNKITKAFSLKTIF